MAAGEGGQQALFDMLGAIGGVEEQFGAAVHRLLVGIQEELPDFGAEFGAAGFTGDE